MWQDTREKFMQNDGVEKHFVAPSADEVRIKVPKDPEQRKIDEQRRLQKERGPQDFSTPGQMQAFMP